jgi:hypothetical protein
MGPQRRGGMCVGHGEEVSMRGGGKGLLIPPPCLPSLPASVSLRPCLPAPLPACLHASCLPGCLSACMLTVCRRGGWGS